MRRLLEGFEVLSESVAQTILQQMGGAAKLKMFIGARDFVSDNGGKTLIFKFPVRQKSAPNMVKITLTPKDTYDMEFGRSGQDTSGIDPEMRAMFKQHGVKPQGTPTYKVVKTFDDVYADQLSDVFERTTGLLLHM